jgi:hypothetical protein
LLDLPIVLLRCNADAAAAQLDPLLGFDPTAESEVASGTAAGGQAAAVDLAEGAAAKGSVAHRGSSSGAAGYALDAAAEQGRSGGVEALDEDAAMPGAGSALEASKARLGARQHQTMHTVSIMITVRVRLWLQLQLRLGL